MKKLIFALIITISSTGLFAQDRSYVITDEAAIEKATWDKYRLVDKRRVITFKEGVIIELLSANEMTEQGLEINHSKVMKQSPKGSYQPLFVLSDNGFIIEQHSYKTKRNQ